MWSLLWTGLASTFLAVSEEALLLAGLAGAAAGGLLGLPL